jgi:protein crumbs
MQNYYYQCLTNYSFLLQYFKCVCPPGYTSELCNEEIDECAGDPCNGGKCIDHLNGFTCDCSETGFRGEQCEVDIDECQTLSLCIQGNCSNLPGSYVCNCLDGYCGTNCQREDPCQLVN